MSPDIKLSELNHTELLTLARELDADVCRSTPKDVLIDILESAPGEEPELEPNPANKRRLRIMEFVIDNQSRLGALLSCPAKSLDKYACFQCLDLQVAECWSTNEHIIASEEKG